MKKARSLAFYKLIVDSSWYIGITVCCIWSIVCLVSIIGDKKIIGTDLISFEIESKMPIPQLSAISEAFKFTMDKPSKVVVTLQNFDVNQITSAFALSYFAFLVVGLLFSFYQLKQMKDLLNDVIRGNIFTSSNARRLKMFGIVELLFIPISVLYYFAVNAIIKDSSLFNTNFKPSLDIQELNQSLIHGLEYLIFAGIFAFGHKLKQENDLTI
ncbi:MAG: DUF2975 domain-containing protein [Pedobacter agri]